MDALEAKAAAALLCVGEKDQSCVLRFDQFFFFRFFGFCFFGSFLIVLRYHSDSCECEQIKADCLDKVQFSLLFHYSLL